MRLLCLISVFALFALAAFTPERSDACGNGGAGSRMAARRAARQGNMMAMNSGYSMTYTQTMQMRGPAMMVVPSRQQAPMVLPKNVRGGCVDGQCTDAELQQQDEEQEPQYNQRQLEFISITQAPPVNESRDCECQLEGGCQCIQCQCQRLKQLHAIRQAPPVLYP